MQEFITANILSIILIGIGLFFVIMTYGAAYKSSISDHFVSGVPFVGMIFLLIGGLLSTYKPLALICLIDPGPWMMICSVVRDYKSNKKFFSYIEQNGFSSDKEYVQNQILTIGVEGKIWELPYRTNYPYLINKQRITFAVIIDGAGDRYILLDKRKEGLVTIFFNEDRIETEGIDSKGNNVALTFEVKPE